MLLGNKPTNSDSRYFYSLRYNNYTMLGLIMLREYLDEILNGYKSYDARRYDTKVRGTIALVDTKKSAIVGLIDLIGTHKISAEEYCKWHATGKWSGIQFAVDDTDATYYAYDFANPRRLANPIKIVKTDMVWTKIDHDTCNKFVVQDSLF